MDEERACRSQGDELMADEDGWGKVRVRKLVIAAADVKKVWVGVALVPSSNTV